MQRSSAMPAPMRLAYRTVTHRLRTPFRVAHGVSTTRTNVFAFTGDGTGEGALVPYYPYRLDDLTAYLDGVDGARFGDEAAFDLDAALDAIPDGPAPARCALDVALHDHAGKRAGQPLWRMWGLDAGAVPPSSYTLSIPSSEEALREAVAPVAHLPVIKLKVGTGDPDADVRLVALARALTRADLGVDANSAWTVDEAARVIPRLANLGVLYVEQPLSWKDPEGHAAWHRLRERLPEGMPPLLADESLQHLGDVDTLAGAADGVNVKLTKTGGLRGARRVIEAARQQGMQVLVGCMVESAVGISAAAHLAPLADYVDLDGAVLLADPVVTGGMGWNDGRLRLPDTPGIGTFTWTDV
jgi:L-Ala-D/L-Glu epimerase